MLILTSVQAEIYAVDSQDVLSIWNPVARTFDPWTQAPVNNLGGGDIAFNSKDGALYFANEKKPFELLRIDITQPSFTFVGQIRVGPNEPVTTLALGYDPEHDVLLGFRETGRQMLYIHQGSGESSPIGSATGNVYDYAYDPLNHRVVGASDGFLYAVNVATGVHSFLASVPRAYDGLAFDPLTNKMLAVEGVSAYYLDPLNNYSETLANAIASPRTLRGLAGTGSAPVPEPASLAALGFGIAMLARARKKRHSM